MNLHIGNITVVARSMQVKLVARAYDEVRCVNASRIGRLLAHASN